MRGMSGTIVFVLSALIIGGCATRSGAMHDKRDSPYENTDRPIVPYENDNRPIMALDFHGDEYAAVRSLSRQQRNMEIQGRAKVMKAPTAF
jgi:hypothetical protein